MSQVQKKMAQVKKKTPGQKKDLQVKKKMAPLFVHRHADPSCEQDPHGHLVRLLLPLLVRLHRARLRLITVPVRRRAGTRALRRCLESRSGMSGEGCLFCTLRVQEAPDPSLFYQSFIAYPL